MLFPIADENDDRRSTPWVNYVIILLNILVFVFLQSLGSNEKFTYAFSTVPAEIISGRDIVTGDRILVRPTTGERVEILGLQPTPIPVFLTLITSMFMHGGLAHIFGNMLFLWIFGDNIEDRLGHIRYLIFYLVCGVLAGLAHVFSTVIFAGGSEASLLVPSLGASGAISGVLGAYILLFPTRRVTVLLSWFVTQVPAFVAIGLWFCIPVDQRAWYAWERLATGRRRLRRTHWWIHRGTGADQGVRDWKAADGLFAARLLNHSAAAVEQCALIG